MAFFGATHALVMNAVLVAVHLLAVIVRRGHTMSLVCVAACCIMA